MIRVWTPSRLHFGLLSLGGGARRFGGVGLMVERPGVQVAASPAEAWSAEGPSADRALAFALRFAESIRREQPDAAGPPQRLVVEQAPPEHVGLGVGTQLGLAVARALAETWGLALDAATLARRVGRGLRSALGVHGFAHGGFLVESGKREGSDGLAPLAARAEFPPDWRVVLATPAEAPGLHGAAEREAFARLAGTDGGLAQTDALCRLVLLGMLPALAERDLEAFGESLYHFNRQVGEAFAAVQGGVYAGSRTAACVEFFRAQGVRGAGQSSWGPTAFAIVGDEDRAAALARSAAERFGSAPERAWVTGGSATGAQVTTE